VLCNELPHVATVYWFSRTVCICTVMFIGYEAGTGRASSASPISDPCSPNLHRTILVSILYQVDGPGKGNNGVGHSGNRKEVRGNGTRLTRE